MDLILLASTSPRRREMLSSLGFDFSAFDPGVDESICDHLSVPERVVALAEAKARSGAESVAHSVDSPRWVLGADTLVWLPAEEIVLGKPDTREDAAGMLRLLAGRTHSVSTGLALVDTLSGKMYSERSDSRVQFAAMTEPEISRYLDSGDWTGAAGSYKIQGLASLHIERIEGSWSGIVGLPIRELYVILCRAGFRLASPGAMNRKG